MKGALAHVIVASVVIGGLAWLLAGWLGVHRGDAAVLLVTGYLAASAVFGVLEGAAQGSRES